MTDVDRPAIHAVDALREASVLILKAAALLNDAGRALNGQPRLCERGAAQNQAEHIIRRFGGISALARSLNLTPSVVEGWKQRGHIPGKRINDVFRAGKVLTPPLAAAEFFESAAGEAAS